jgi:hypothetical protein
VTRCTDATSASISATVSHPRNVFRYVAVMLPEAHVLPLDHPVVHAYVSLRSFRSLARQLDAVIAEIRDRTKPGARILCAGLAQPSQVVELARALPDQHVDAIDACAERVQRVAAMAARAEVRNLQCHARDFAKLDLPSGGTYQAVVGLRSLHHIKCLEAFWSASRRVLAAGGVVLAQEYVGPPDLRWSPVQCDAATHALQTLVPPALRRHHDRVGPSLAQEVLAAAGEGFPRSDEVMETCIAAGFTITGHAAAGCSLLIPVLVGQDALYNPRDWSHNLVLAQLFAEESRLVAEGTLRHDFAMFVAQAPS